MKGGAREHASNKTGDPSSARAALHPPLLGPRRRFVGLATLGSRGYAERVDRAPIAWKFGALLLLVNGCDDFKNGVAAIPPAQAAASASPPRAPVSSNDTRSPCAAEMVEVGVFCIDRYEAHLVHADSGKLHPATRELQEGVAYQARSQPGMLPQAYISRDEAAAACEHAGKRLCSAREWQQACKGRAGFKYPYGRDEVVGRCNKGKAHVPAVLFGSGVTRLREQHLNDPRLNQLPGFLAKTGEHPDCVSDYGVYDMVGNLQEWVADDVNSALPRKIPVPQGVQNLGRRGNGVFMGGYVSSHREHGRGCEYVTTHHAPSYHDYSIGFRCCAVAKR